MRVLTGGGSPFKLIEIIGRTQFLACVGPRAPVLADCQSDAALVLELLTVPCLMGLPKMATWFFKSSKGERVSRMKDAIILCSKSCTSIPMHPLILALLCWLETRHKWCPYSRWGDETRTCTSEGENHGCYPRVYLPHSLKQEGSLLR